MGRDLRMPVAFVALQRSQVLDVPDAASPARAASATRDVSDAKPSPVSLDSYADSQAAGSDQNGNEDEFFFNDGPTESRSSVSASSTINTASGDPQQKALDIDRHARGPESAPHTQQNGVAVTENCPGSQRSRNTLTYASAPTLAHSISPPESPAMAQARIASTASFSSGVDRYGFKTQSQYISAEEFNAWSSRYTRYCEHRKAKWRVLLKDHGLDAGTETEAPVRFPPESQQLKRYVRKGIPPEWRGNAWFWYARGHEKLNAHPGLYPKLVEEAVGLKNNDTEHIERDLHRTFPDNINFRNDPLTNQESSHLQSLRRVLRTFSMYQPKIGYCQSLNFIAGNLLLFIDEERAFWLLVIITQNYLAGLHDVNLEQVNISQGVLMISVRDRLPKIWTALNLEQSFEDNFISNLPPISLCTAPWFMSVMVNVLPTETMMRVWDCFFVEGPKTLYRIALTIFKLVEPQLCRAADELEVFQIVQSAPRRLYDPEVLMKSCFRRTNGFGHMSNEDIAMLRVFVQSRRKLALDGSQPATSDRHEYAKLHRGRRIKAKLSLYR